ncbi:MAG: exodeoxyribonuclease VII large subunit [Burkholderiaceae bacterium]
MALESDAAEPALARVALTVSALNRTVSSLLERSFPLVRVRGEISNLTRAASGHWYFALKDDAAQVRCVMFRGRNVLVDWAPREGDEVEILAIVSLYEARGEFQLNVESMQRAGLGRLYEEFLRLKARLAAEGLFDADRRRALPRIPRAIGIVTSLQAAALADVLTALARRAPYLRVVIYTAPVQGQGAGARIADALAQAARRAEVDVLLLVRGGGSIEDLWAFNEEVVARAIRACAIPVVVGVGHESDVTIADFVADLRAPTPTAAAEQVAPAASDLIDELAAQRARLLRPLIHRLQVAAQRLDYTQRALAVPRSPIVALETRLASLQGRAIAAIARRLANGRSELAQLKQGLLARPRAATSSDLRDRVARLTAGLHAQRHRYSIRTSQLAARLGALDPHAVLARGYSLVLAADGRIVSDAGALTVGEQVRLMLARGSASARIESIEREPNRK